jgi:hypothetical protein
MRVNYLCTHVYKLYTYVYIAYMYAVPSPDIKSLSIYGPYVYEPCCIQSAYTGYCRKQGVYAACKPCIQDMGILRTIVYFCIRYQYIKFSCLFVSLEEAGFLACLVFGKNFFLFAPEYDFAGRMLKSRLISWLLFSKVAGMQK